MLYQLPTGKVVWLELDDILNLTKEDMQFLLATNSGEYIHNPFKHSVISTQAAKSEEADESESIDTDEEIETYYEEFFPDDFPDIPDDINFNFDE
jgi:hypothetical protein